jgi:hypothetical protein
MLKPSTATNNKYVQFRINSGFYLVTLKETMKWGRKGILILLFWRGGGEGRGRVFLLPSWEGVGEALLRLPEVL